MRQSLLFILALLLCTTSAFSNCDNDPDNLFQSANCDFDANVTGWTVNGTGVFNSDDYNGSGTSGSIQVDSIVPAPGAPIDTAGANQCFNVSTDTTIKTAGAWFRSNSAADFDCRNQVQFYEGTNCNLSNQGMCDSAYTQLSAGSNWTNLSCNSPLLSGSVQSIRVTLTCANGSIHGGPSSTQVPFSVKMDNVYVVPENQMPVELMKFSID